MDNLYEAILCIRINCTFKINDHEGKSLVLLH